ncbi:MAG TPA: hypothetical protein VGK19_20370 [Capsulimonadaceae bacterium]|jgi:hypothetical protein
MTKTTLAAALAVSALLCSNISFADTMSDKMMTPPGNHDRMMNHTAPMEHGMMAKHKMHPKRHKMHGKMHHKMMKGKMDGKMMHGKMDNAKMHGKMDGHMGDSKMHGKMDDAKMHGKM